MRRIIREIRGIPFFLLMEYLEEMGGTAMAEGHLRGSGWEVHAERIEPFRIGSLEVGQSRLEIEIEDERADDFMRELSQKTLRAGG